MGIFVNPGNASFTEALNSKIYVDKSGLISVINQRIKTQQKYICVSRPRRFGKSLNLGMLAAFYSKGCNSHELFDNLAISCDKAYEDHLNRYNVLSEYAGFPEYKQKRGGNDRSSDRKPDDRF